LAYSIAIPSHRKALERKADRLLAQKAQKRPAKRKRYFAKRGRWQARQAFLERQAKRAAAGMASHEHMASHD